MVAEYRAKARRYVYLVRSRVGWVTRVCRRRRGDGCGRSGRSRVRGLERPVGVGFAVAVEWLAGRCWVGRFVLKQERGRSGVGSRRWSMGRDRGRVLRCAQDDRLVALARRIVAGLRWRGRGKWSGRC